MEIAPELNNNSKYIINSINKNYIIINNHKYSNNLILTTEQLYQPATTEEWSNHLEQIKRFKPDLVLYSTGDKFSLPNSPEYLNIIKFLQQNNLNHYEFMHNHAIAKIFAATAAEQRKVLAVFRFEFELV